MRLWAILLIGQCLIVPGWSQISFQCAVDSNKMLIGDQRNLLLSINADAPVRVDSIDFGDWKELGVELLSVQQWSPTESNQISQQFKIGVFDTGYIKLPPLSLHYSSSGRIDTAYSNDLALEVSGIMVDSTGLAPIKPILKEPLAFRDFLPYLTALIIGLAIVGLFFLRSKRKLPEPTVVVIPDPPHEIALRDLQRLKEQKLWQQGKIKAYQSQLTHIIRAYLEGRYEIPALESTTTEVLEALNKADVSEKLYHDLNQILNMADLIKFAKAKPDVDIHHQFMDMAEKFVLATKLESSKQELDD